MNIFILLFCSIIFLVIPFQNCSKSLTNKRSGHGGDSVEDTSGQKQPEDGVAETPIMLLASGAIIAAEDGQIIENLNITTTIEDECAITVKNKSNITIRNVNISNKNIGICAENVTGLTIDKVKLMSTSAPASGPHCAHGTADCNLVNQGMQADPDTRFGIHLQQVIGGKIDNIYSEKQSAGISLSSSPGTEINNFICIDARGPLPRGNCLILSRSNNSKLTNFYTKNFKATSDEHSVINIYLSENVSISEGLIDGSWSPLGSGIMIGTGSHNGNVSNIDLVRTGNQAIGVWTSDIALTARDAVYSNIRVKDTTCLGRNDEALPSGGHIITNHPTADNPTYSNIIYFNHCRVEHSKCLPTAACSVTGTGSVDIQEQDFTLKVPMVLTFPWEE